MEHDSDWLTKPLLPRSRDSTPGKSLRFNVPKKLPPLEMTAEPNEEICIDIEKEVVESESSSSDIEVIEDSEERKDELELQLEISQSIEEEQMDLSDEREEEIVEEIKPFW